MKEGQPRCILAGLEKREVRGHTVVDAVRLPYFSQILVLLANFSAYSTRC